MGQIIRYREEYQTQLRAATTREDALDCCSRPTPALSREAFSRDAEPSTATAPPLLPAAVTAEDAASLAVGDGAALIEGFGLWGEGFAEVCAIEPAIMELVVARIARLTHGSRVET